MLKPCVTVERIKCTVACLCSWLGYRWPSRSLVSISLSFSGSCPGNKAHGHFMDGTGCFFCCDGARGGAARVRSYLCTYQTLWHAPSLRYSLPCTSNFTSNFVLYFPVWWSWTVNTVSIVALYVYSRSKPHLSSFGRYVTCCLDQPLQDQLQRWSSYFAPSDQ